MDPQAWALIRQLEYNPRLSYQTLSKKFNVSPNTIKNRLKKMREQRMIGRGYALLSREMVGVEDTVSVISTDGREKGVDLMKHIATHPTGCEIYRTGDRRYELWSMVAGTSEAFSLIQFLENLDNVIHVKMRPIVFIFPHFPPNYFMNTRGKKVNFTQNQLDVLRQLLENMRMPVSQIAQRTGLTSRRVRKIISDLQWGGGVHLLTGYNPFALGDLEYRLKVWFEPTQTTGQELATAIAEKYPDTFWWSSVTTNEPILDVGLIISDANQVPPIIREVKENPHITSLEDFVTYPRTVWPRSPLLRALRKLLGIPDPLISKRKG